MICHTIVFLAILTVVLGKVYFEEDFNDLSWKQRWVSSPWEYYGRFGAWKRAAVDYRANPNDMGIQIAHMAGYYSLTAKLNSTFTNMGTELVIQMSVKHGQGGDCSGASIKLLGDPNPNKPKRRVPSQIDFGPGICGSGLRLTDITFHYPPKNVALTSKRLITARSDREVHLYTLVVKPDNTYEVLIDLETVQSGNLNDDFGFFVPRPFDHYRPGSLPPEEKASELYVRCRNCTQISLHMEQRSAGTLIDDIIITDSFAEAKAHAEKTFLQKRRPCTETVERERYLRVIPDPAPISTSLHEVYTAVANLLRAVMTALMNQPAQHQPAIIKTKASKPFQLDITTTNPLNSHSIQWTPLIDMGAEMSVMDLKSAKLLGLQQGQNCSVYDYAGWTSVIELRVDGSPVQTTVCVNTMGYSLLGRPLMEAQDLCHCPKRGIVKCIYPSIVFST